MEGKDDSRRRRRFSIQSLPQNPIRGRNLLFRVGRILVNKDLRTKRALANTSSDEFSSLRDVGKKSVMLINTMRNVAVAELALIT